MTLETDRIIERVGERAEALYRGGGMLCAEAVLTALNQEFAGGLPAEQISGLAAGFAMGLGEAGCLCGALSGGVMGLGLLLGAGGPLDHGRVARRAARRLHQAFKETEGSTCCRVLSSKVKHDKKVHFEQCAGITGRTARAAARVLLEERPRLAAASNGEPLRAVGAGGLGRLWRRSRS
ncbi:MAG: C-GCAxxG-C-C family protein [Deltaproteobacteria bacterium]|nr:C-GCAxxG-C-C family protein [Deltaproteobacteria bacterium]